MNDYISLLRKNRAYRLLWLGAVASYMGDWFNLIASADLIASLTDSGAAISFLFLARFLPSFVLSPFAGVLADRFNRKYLMVGTDIARAGIVLCFLFVRSAEQIWLLYTLTVLQFALSAVFIPAKSAVLANIVDDKDLVTANALDSTTWSLMLAVGALLGGIVTAGFGTNVAFVADAATFVVAGILIAMIRAPGSSYSGEEAAGGGFLEFIDGLRYLKGLPFILALALVKAGGSLVWGATNVIEVEFANEIFPIGGDGATTLGIIYAITGIGTGLGPILMRRWLTDAQPRLRLGILIGYLCATVGIALVGIAPTFAVLGVGTFLRTWGTGTLWVFSSALLQLNVADRVRGRVFAFEFAMLTLTQSISILYAGQAIDRLGWSIRAVTLSTAVVGVGVSLVWTVIILRWRRKEGQLAHSL